MMKDNMGWRCRCWHHWVAYLLVALTWLSAVGFFWAEWSATLVMGFDSAYFFQAAILFALLAFGTKFCTCCCGGYGCGGDRCGVCMPEKGESGECKHPMGCKCGDCSRCR